MKNWRKYAAILGIVILLVIFCLPMYFALKGNFSMKELIASYFVVLFVAIMCYVILMMFRLLNKKKEDEHAVGSIKNVIFDVGLVLVDFKWESYMDTFGFDKEKYDKIANAVFLSPVWDERDRGLYDEETYIKKCQEAAPEYADDIAFVMKGTPKTISRMPYAETWAKYLKSKGYNLYILSNLSEYMKEGAKKEMTFLKYMYGTVFSCDVKQLKPEPEIYQTLLKKYSLNPSECVFIDDREVNCEGARAQGIKSICFKNFKQAAAELEQLGVK